MTLADLISRLEDCPEDTQFAFVWYEKDEIDEDITDEEWLDLCDTLFLEDAMLDTARDCLGF